MLKYMYMYVEICAFIFRQWIHFYLLTNLLLFEMARLRWSIFHLLLYKEQKLIFFAKCLPILPMNNCPLLSYFTA